jgi:ribosome biogenesis protein Nip4
MLRENKDKSVSASFQESKKFRIFMQLTEYLLKSLNKKYYVKRRNPTLFDPCNKENSVMKLSHFDKMFFLFFF